MTALPVGYERRYTSRTAKVAHAVDVERGLHGGLLRPGPGIRRNRLARHLHAGRVRERAAALPLCYRCYRYLFGEVPQS